MARYLWIIAIVLGVMAFRGTNSTQPPVQYTGAPFDRGSCGSCHSGGSGTPTITLLADGTPLNGQVAYGPGGQPMNMEVRVSHPSASVGGFELTVATSPPGNDPGPTGGLSAGPGTVILTAPGNRRYLSHSGTQNFSGGTVSWNFTWTPPATNVGTLRWYIAVNAANRNRSTSGDATATTTVDMPADVSNALEHSFPASWYCTYDSFGRRLFIGGAERAELFGLDGRLVLSLSGSGPHDLQVQSGVYLLRLHLTDGSQVSTRLFIP